MKFMEKLLVGEKVEWKKLGEVANCFSGGTPKTSNSSFYDGEIPWIRSGEINFNVIKKSERNITKEGLEKSSAKMIKKNSVVLAMTGATVGRTAVVEIETSSNQSVAAIETNNRIINYKYLFYFLAKEYNNLKKLGQGALTSLNLSIIKNIKIPVPSIETQEKIVKIFDSYTEYVTELQEKLKKELQARNKQYNYYRDMLLSEDYLNKISNKIFMQLDNVIHKTKLIEIAKLSRGKRLVRSELHENGQYPVFQNSLTPLGYYNNKNFDGGKTCIVTAGAAGEIFYQDRDFWAADDVLVITTDDILNKYLYYFLLNKQNLIKSKVRKASVPRLSRDDIEKIEVSLPPIEIQNKIVKILDRFQELLSDTKGLLPLEIEQRRKQYEYYREKLLTFDSICARTNERTNERTLITKQYLRLIDEAAEVAGVNVSYEVEWKTLREIAVGNLTYGSGASAIEYDGEVRYVRITDIDINGNLKEEKFSPSEVEEKYFLNYGDILFARSGATVGKNYIHQTEEKSIYAGYLIKLIVNQKLALAKYIYHCINTTEYFKFVENTRSNGSQPNINAKQYSDFKILLPPMPVQEYIVSILDKFDALVNDLSQGLPKEIALRQKQYEYYREKLLNFEK